MNLITRRVRVRETFDKTVVCESVPIGPVIHFQASGFPDLSSLIGRTVEVVADENYVMQEIYYPSGVVLKPFQPPSPQPETEPQSEPEPEYEGRIRENVIIRHYAGILSDGDGNSWLPDELVVSYFLSHGCINELHDLGEFRVMGSDEPWQICSAAIRHHHGKLRHLYFRMFEPGFPFGKLTVAAPGPHGPGPIPTTTLLVPSDMEIKGKPGVGEYVRLVLAPDNIVLAAEAV